MFGLYLLMIAWLAWRSGYVPRLLGVLVAIAGLGYIYDSIGQFISGGSWTQVSTVTFTGEFLLALWLVIWGRRITVSQPVLRAEPGRASAMTAAAPGTAAAATMTAIVQDDYGTAPEAVLRLAEITRPAIADDEILVRVRAASVDRGTWHLLAGLAYPMRLAGFGLRRPKAPNPGRSLAGRVESAGQEVTGFKPGDEVYGTGDGSFAPYAAPRRDGSHRNL